MKGFSLFAAVALCAPVIGAQAQPSTPMDQDSSSAPARSYTFTFKQTSKDACVLQSGRTERGVAGPVKESDLAPTGDGRPLLLLAHAWRRDLRWLHVALPGARPAEGNACRSRWSRATRPCGNGCRRHPSSPGVSHSRPANLLLG